LADEEDTKSTLASVQRKIIQLLQKLLGVKHFPPDRLIECN